ncbi:MAG: glycosyl hydrolase family 17 protein [Candidatus Hodarchaeales archaeon]|jgi:exo-beta-1,3-glucanase (GH17 family)
MKKVSNLIFFFLLTIIIVFSQANVSHILALNDNSKPKSTWKQTSSTLDFHGLCYGAFRYFGPPGEWISSKNVEEDLEILKQLNVTDIRTYGMNYGQNVIPEIAHEKGINIATGIWLTPNTSIQNHYLNEYEITTGLSVADISSALIVGNEVLLRPGMSVSTLIEYISKVQNKTSTPVTTAEPWNIWDQNPQLVNACDVLFVHVYSYWEGKPSPTYGNMAAEYTVEKIEYLQNKYPYKEIYLAEAGWPSGPRIYDPDRYSEPVQKEFYNDLLPMLAEKEIKSYLFEAFDELWKESQEPGVGPNWGIFREDRTPKSAAAVLTKYFGGSVEWPEPTINSPKDIVVIQNETVNISWTVYDIDNTSGTYTVYLNDIVLGQPNDIWMNGTSINITVDTTTVDTLNYTIVFTDGISTGQDTVIVTVNLPITSTTTTTTTATSPGFDILVWIISLSAILLTRTIFLKKHASKEY